MAFNLPWRAKANKVCMHCLTLSSVYTSDQMTAVRAIQQNLVQSCWVWSTFRKEKMWWIWLRCCICVHSDLHWVECLKKKQLSKQWSINTIWPLTRTVLNLIFIAHKIYLWNLNWLLLKSDAVIDMGCLFSYLKSITFYMFIWLFKPVPIPYL